MNDQVKAIICLSALRHNFRMIRKLTSAKILCVIKSDAYGHGLKCIAHELEKEGADAFAVSHLCEALKLREYGIKQPIVLLQGCMTACEFEIVEKHNLIMVIHNIEQVQLLLTYKAVKQFNIWLKIDSGMHRLGFSVEEFDKIYTRVANCSSINEIVLISHFSCANDPENPYTFQQFEIFKQTVKCLNHQISLRNSAAILCNDIEDDWVRPGLMLTGISPVEHKLKISLKPVMQLESRIIATKEIEANQPIGYGNTFITSSPMRLGIVAIGYANGYPQNMPKGTPVLVNNRIATIVGQVSMDMISIDITSLPEVNVGFSVILWGDKLSITKIAEFARMTPYALMTGLQRIKRVYIN